MKDKSNLFIFMDEETRPIAELVAPVNFDLDTTKLVDGKHCLKIVSKDPSGKEGVRFIPFEVKNGPAISIEGISEGSVVDGIVPIMLNAYSKGNQKNFLIKGSETPHSIPFWIFILLVVFIAWATYYFATSSSINLIK